MSINGSVRIIRDVTEHLHTNDGVDEEQHDHQHHNIRQRLQVKQYSFYLSETFFSRLEGKEQFIGFLPFLLSFIKIIGFFLFHMN